MKKTRITSCPELMEAIDEIGLVPLLDSGIRGFSADEMVAPECRYVVTDEGWDWPLWEWKGPMVTEGHYAYGKFFGLRHHGVVARPLQLPARQIPGAR